VSIAVRAAIQPATVAPTEIPATTTRCPQSGAIATASSVAAKKSDARKFAPRVWLTAAVYNWGPYYLKRVKAAADGTWKMMVGFGA